MQFLSFPAISVEPIKNLYQPYGIEADVLRLDRLHPVVSGNKWFKLKEYVKKAQANNQRVLLTFGGPYSNHIVATAAAAKALGLESIGVIRGEKPAQLSYTLEKAIAYGMQLHFTSRDEYKSKSIPAIVFEQYAEREVAIIGEGGYGLLGRQGAAAILDYCKADNYTHIITAVGTGTTLAGLVSGSITSQQVIGISVLKNAFSLTDEVNALLPPSLHNHFRILHDYHFGGYAKSTPLLLQFMNDWLTQTGIPSDFVYTGKLFFAVDNLIRSHFFPAGSRLLLLHTGGLQGNRSLPKDTLIF